MRASSYRQNDNADTFLSPDCSDILFLRWLEKSVGKKDIAESGKQLQIKNYLLFRKAPKFY